MPPQEKPRIALDIETVPLVTDPDFQDPSDWKPFCIAAGYQSARGEPIDIEVLFRDGPLFEHERLMFADFFDWVNARHNTRDRIELITYNGEVYDIPILQKRAYKIADERDSDTVSRLYRLLQACDHTDLIQILEENLGYYPPLDDALAMHNLTFSVDSPTWDGSKVDGEDMLDMGQAVINGTASDDLIEAVRRYAASDVQPLFNLRNKLEDKVEGKSRA